MATKVPHTITKFSIFFLLVSSNLNAATINGFELKEIIEEWLVKEGKPANISILEEIKYPKCDLSDIILNDISGNGKLIKINCIGKNPWQFIVRNKLVEKKKIKKNKKNYQVYALKTFKNKGAIINDDDLKVVNRKNGISHMFIADKSEIIGRKLKKNTTPNQPLRRSSLLNNWLIEKNSLVTIINKKSFITIKEQGVALNDANYMEKINVKNVKSGKIIVGYVKNQKKVIMNTKQ